PHTAIESMRLDPDVDASLLKIAVKTTGGAAVLRAAAFDGSREVASASGSAAEPLSMRIPAPKLWSPDSPHLYDLKLSLSVAGREIDRVTSYFGMRKIALGKDSRGRTRL